MRRPFSRTKLERIWQIRLLTHDYSMSFVADRSARGIMKTCAWARITTRLQFKARLWLRWSTRYVVFRAISRLCLFVGMQDFRW